MILGLGNTIPSDSVRQGLGGGGGGDFTNTYSLAFDGVDDFIGFSPLEFSAEFTLSAWVKPVSLSANQGNIISSATSNANKIGISSASSVQVKLGGILSTITDGGSNNFSIGVWQHILIIRDSSNIVTVFRNGSAFGSPSSANAGSGKYDSIGKFNNTQFLDEQLDEVAYWTSDQSANIASIYSASGAVDLSSLNPTVWYRMGDNGSYKSPQWLIPENSNVANSRISNYSFSYDGVDDIISMGDVLDFDYNEPFTISAWINLEAFSYSFAGVVSKQEASGNFRGYFLHIDETSGVYNLKFILGNTLSNRIRIQGTTDLLGLGWTHIACTYDGSTNASGTKLYINGSLETLNAGLTQDTLGSNTTLNSASFNIGSRGGSRFFEGNIDEVSVFNSELSSTDINSLYGGGNPTTITGAVAHWKMGEEATFSTNWTVPDAVGSNNGTSANMSIEDRVGEAPNSNNNALSYNMTESDRETDVPT